MSSLSLSEVYLPRHGCSHVFSDHSWLVCVFKSWSFIVLMQSLVHILYISEPCFNRGPSVSCFLQLFSAFDGVLLPHEGNQKGEFLEGGYSLQNPHRQLYQPRLLQWEDWRYRKPVASPVKLEACVETFWLQLKACTDAPPPPDFSKDVIMVPPPADSVLVLWVILPGCPVSTSWLQK